MDIKTLTKPKPWGEMSLGYQTFVMPLEVAHKVQVLLAEHAFASDTVYRGSEGSIYFVKPTDVPTVVIRSMEAVIDTRMLTEEQRTKWIEAVRGSKGNEFMQPEDFALYVEDE